MSADFSEAQWLPSTRYWKGHAGATPRWIVIHGTAGGTDAQAVGTWLNTNSEHVASVHYVIGTDGRVVQLVSEEDSAWGNGPISAGAAPWWQGVVNHNPNWVTFSIEHCKPSTDNHDQLTPAQKSASFRLVLSLCRRHNIPARAGDGSGGIVGHNSIDPVERARCPGPYPWDELYAYLAANLTDRGAQPAGDQMFPKGTPAGWRDDGTTLTAPNGKPVKFGFRDFVRNVGWNPADQPLAPEEAANPADAADSHSGAGSRQFFLDTVLIWTPAKGVYRGHAGQMAFALEGQAVTATKAATAAATSDGAVEKRKRQKLEADIATAEKALETSIQAAVTAAEA